jgi:hypothetical protein
MNKKEKLMRMDPVAKVFVSAFQAVIESSPKMNRKLKKYLKRPTITMVDMGKDIRFTFSKIPKKQMAKVGDIIEAVQTAMLVIYNTEVEDNG